MTLSPSLDDIAIRHGLFRDCRVEALDEDCFRALVNLVRFTASERVWTYTAPTDGRLRDDDKVLWRLSGLTTRKWKKARPVVSQFFTIVDGYWFLNEDWISIKETGVKRPVISASLRAAALKQSDYRCGYCGCSDGPFDIDHIIPIIKGGSNDLDNLIAACCSCNRSKGARTPEEWVR